jgi:hypothetical protein
MSLTAKFSRYYEQYFNNINFNQQDLKQFIRMTYYENLVSLGKIAMKPDEKKEFCKPRIEWLKAEIEALTDYADKNNISLFD